MKNYLLFATLLGLIIILPKSIIAQDHGFGLGLILGEPTGLSAKFWTSKVNAFDFGLGVSVGGDRISHKYDYDKSGRIHFHMDYLWHSFNAISSTERFPLYYGLGGQIQLWRRIRRFNRNKRRVWHSLASTFNTFRHIFRVSTCFSGYSTYRTRNRFRYRN